MECIWVLVLVLFDLASSAGDIAITIPWIAVAAFFALWVHRSEGNRALTMGLYIVFGALAWFGFLYGLGSLYREYREGEALSRSGWTYMVGGLAAALPLIPPTRRLLAKIIPFDPKSKPDMVGLVILLAAGTAAAVQLFYTTDVEEPPTYAELIQQLILIMAVAILAVGTFIVRSPREALARLGIVRPTLKQVLVALGCVVVAFAVAIVAQVLVHWLQPDVYDRIQDNLKTLTENYSSVWGAVFIGLASGIGEELLFRGAIQPRYGVVFTALVFALLHIQYDASFIVVGVFGAGIIFGLERKHMNTTTSIITHTLYNTIAILLSI
jgi:membrane protease YdiL (CAAX protease family)